jgi:hypothetical protein
MIFVYIYEDSLIKPTKHCLKMMGGSKGKEGYKGEGELIQSILYTSMELK